MCCSTETAAFANTTVYAGEAELEGRLVHVLGYENSARNLAGGPNAMLLHFPAVAGTMGVDSIIDTSACKHILKDMVEAVFPDMLSVEDSLGDLDGDLPPAAPLVFDSGMYTVVLADDARTIPSALPRVPAEKRPRVNEAVFEFYAQQFPGWPIALCCFNGDLKSDPLLWWYEPRHPDTLFAPGLDAHDGGPPKLKAVVQRDHNLILGSHLGRGAYDIRYRDELTGRLASLLPQAANGRKLVNPGRQGDFLAPVEWVRDGRADFRTDILRG